jgi:hypothetical protein
MEELSFKIVRMHGPRDEVIARVQNFLIRKAAFEKALFVLSGCPLGDAPGRADHFEVERGTALLSPSLRLGT